MRNKIISGKNIFLDEKNGFKLLKSKLGILKLLKFEGDFWDRYHDGDEEAEKTFAEVMKRLKEFHGWS